MKKYLPILLMGHSMGSFLSRSYLIRYPGTVDAAIIMGTGWQPEMTIRGGLLLAGAIARIKGPDAASKLVTNMAFGAYNKAFGDKQVLREDVRKMPLRAGDMLVLHSIWQDLAKTAKSLDFLIVTDYPKGEQRPHKFKIAMAIFAITIVIALTSKLPVALTLMTGVAGMLLTGVLRMDEAYGAINWKTVFLMAGLIPLGWAMDSSGAAAWVA